MNDVIQELDEFSFHHTIEESKGVSLVFFTGPDCSSCHHLREVFVSCRGLFNSSFNNFNVYEIKADRASALVNEFGVFHLPSIFLYNKGHFHCELQTQALPNEIIKATKLALSKPATEEP